MKIKERKLSREINPRNARHTKAKTTDDGGDAFSSQAIYSEPFDEDWIKL